VLNWLEELTALFRLLPAAVVLLYLRRRRQGHAGFTDRDWRFLFGHPGDKVLSARLCLRFAALWLSVASCFQYRILCDAAWFWDGQLPRGAYDSGHFGNYAEVDAVKLIADGRGQT
jgi:hypothetical protein